MLVDIGPDDEQMTIRRNVIRGKPDPAQGHSRGLSMRTSTLLFGLEYARAVAS